MKLSIVIDLSGAAFKGDDVSAIDYAAREEIVRILRDYADDLLNNHPVDTKLRDKDGYVVGLTKLELA